MAVISPTPPIELTDIRNAIGGTLPKTLRDYILGAGLTPANAIGTNGFLPTSGAIELTDFLGLTYPMNFSGTSASAYAWQNGGQGSTTAFFTLENNGSISISSWNDIGNSTDTSGSWLERTVSNPTSTICGNFDVFVTSSGSLTVGTLSTWIQLSSSRTWLYDQSFNGTTVRTLTVSIRRRDTLATVLSNMTVTLTATRTAELFPSGGGGGGL